MTKGSPFLTRTMVLTSRELVTGTLLPYLRPPFDDFARRNLYVNGNGVIPAYNGRKFQCRSDPFLRIHRISASSRSEMYLMFVVRAIDAFCPSTVTTDGLAKISALLDSTKFLMPTSSIRSVPLVISTRSTSRGDVGCHRQGQKFPVRWNRRNQ